MAYRDSAHAKANSRSITIFRSSLGTRAVAVALVSLVAAFILRLAVWTINRPLLECRRGIAPRTASCAVVVREALDHRTPDAGSRRARTYNSARVDRRVVQDDGHAVTRDVLVLDYNGFDSHVIDPADSARSRRIAEEFNQFLSSGERGRAWLLRERFAAEPLTIVLLTPLLAVAFVALFFRRTLIAFDARERAVVVAVGRFPRARRWAARIDDIERVERVDGQDDKGLICSLRLVTRSGQRCYLGIDWRNPDRVDELVARITSALTSWRDPGRAIPMPSSG